jgi:hypothetical protein
MSLVIDTSTAQTSTFFDQLTQLDGVQYLFNFWWSDREAAWYLGLYDQNENGLAVGLRLNVTWNLLRRFRDPRLPPGVLMCVDMTGTNTDMSAPAELGQRVQLVYFTSDEVAALTVSA